MCIYGTAIHSVSRYHITLSTLAHIRPDKKARSAQRVRQGSLLGSGRHVPCYTSKLSLALRLLKAYAQSDDKTVKIWNTEDWSLVNSVERPFANSPKSTFFRRLRSAHQFHRLISADSQLVARWRFHRRFKRHERPDLRGPGY